MPNHCINELVFRNLSPQSRDALFDKTLSDGEIDFNVLLPIPLNAWMGSVGLNHENAFKITALDWCTENWGTKWGPYGGPKIEETADSITFTFRTAWRPPYGWIVAIFNSVKIDFDHNWFSEGGAPARHGQFRWSEMEKSFGNPWTEIDATELEHRRLHKMLFGVEEFIEEADDEPA